MKKIAIIFLITSAILLCIDVVVFFVGKYQYSKNFESYWSLAEKASSIEKKIEGIDKFVSALEDSDLKGQHNAVFFKTPDNSFDENLEALKSLQVRLHEIKNMDVKSFEYQTALQQITQQEQNEAGEMLSVFKGIWWKHNHFMLWDWVFAVQGITLAVILIFSFVVATEEIYR